jgi:putative transcriptional regulator
MTRTELLAPGFLVASPRLDGSLFERAVIVMVNHDEEGAMGFIVNKPLEVDFGSLLEMVEIDTEEIAPACYEQDVYFGGPVRVEQLWVIYHGLLPSAQLQPGFGSLQAEGEVRFHPQWALSGTSDSIETFAFGREPNPFRPFVGYAGWGPGQLEQEIGEGSWLMLEFDEQFVLDARADDIWDAALARLGVNETAFMMMGKGGVA